MKQIHYILIIAAIITIGVIAYIIRNGRNTEPSLPKPEIYCIGTNEYRYVAAHDICRKLGGRLATKVELYKAYQAGADWCTLGWVDDLKAYSISRGGTTECLSGFRGGSMPGQLKLGAVCYGIKPTYVDAKKTGLHILPWNSSKWSYYL